MVYLVRSRRTRTVASTSSGQPRLRQCFARAHGGRVVPAPTSRPIFQMRLGLSSQYEVGYALGDEKLDKEDGQYSLAYTIAGRADLSLKNSEYYLPEEERDD